MRTLKQLLLSGVISLAAINLVSLNSRSTRRKVHKIDEKNAECTVWEDKT